MPAPRALLLSLALASVRPPPAACARLEAEVAEGGTRGVWPLESTPEEAISLEDGSTCHFFEDGGPLALAADEGKCEVLVLPTSRLVYLKIWAPDDPDRVLQDRAVRIDAVRVRGGQDREGPFLEFHDVEATGGKKVLVRPGGDAGAAQRLVNSIVKAAKKREDPMARKREDPVAKKRDDPVAKKREDPTAKTIEVDFTTPCFKETAPKSPAAGGSANTVRVHWDVAAHHLTVAVTSREELTEVPTEEAAELKQSLPSAWHRLKTVEEVSPDMPPPSCYLDERASPDCGLFEPHLGELRRLIECLGMPTDGFRNQARIADFLRRLVFGLRARTSPKEFAKLATRALLRTGAEAGVASPRRVMPGEVAKCFHLYEVDSTVTMPVRAVACHLPMASATGFGMLYSGIMDEAAYGRKSKVLAAVLQKGGFEPGSVDALGHPLLVWEKVTVQQPYTTIAEYNAPAICARVVVDRLRRMSFMKYDTYAWFGDNTEPLKSLEPAGPDAVKNCIAGANPGVLYDGGSNCRYYIGCFMRLMGSFNEIPGVPAELVALCTPPGRTLVERDPQWMGVDNAYWMSSVGKSSYDLLTGIGSLLPGQGSPKQLAGFRVGDVVRRLKPEPGDEGLLYFVASLYHEGDGGLLCLKRGALQAGCHAPEALQYVPASGWTLQVGTALPVPVG